MFCLVAFVGCSKVEAEFAVKYTASCPLSPESFMIIDNGAQIIKPSRKSQTYVRLHPGKHTIFITHPWCRFYTVSLDLGEDGSFEAVSNSTKTTKYPIKISHQQLEDDDPMMGLLKSPIVIIAIVISIGIRLLKGYLGKPEVIEKIQKFRDDVISQQQQMLQKKKKKKND